MLRGTQFLPVISVTREAAAAGSLSLEFPAAGAGDLMLVRKFSTAGLLSTMFFALLCNPLPGVPGTLLCG